MSAMSLQTIFMIFAVILLVGESISAPGRKHGTRTNGKPAGKISGRLPVKGGGKGGGKSPVVQQKKDNNRPSLPLDILPYHYTVNIVPDVDNSTFFGEVSIDFEAGRSTQEIILHASNLQIDYDKVVLMERRCIPPNVIEATSTPVLNPSTPEYVAPSPAALSPSPEDLETQPQTSQTETPTYPEESLGVTDKDKTPPPVPITGEVPAMPEEAPVMPVEAAIMLEEALAKPEVPAVPEGPVVPEETLSMPEEASAMEEAAPPVGEVLEKERVPAPAKDKTAVIVEEASVLSEQISPIHIDAPPKGFDSPEGPFEVPSFEGRPVTMNEVPSMSDEATVSQPETFVMPEKTHIPPSTSEVAPVVPETTAAVTSPSAEEIFQPEHSTVQELLVETTVKDTFNLAGEALKILEVLNRSDIPSFIKVNLTDDDDNVNLTNEEGAVGQEIEKNGHFMDELETRTDDLVIEDCQKVEVVQPPPSNFQLPLPEDGEGLEQTTAGMFSSIRTALDKLVQTTLAPLLGDQSSSNINNIKTEPSTLNDRGEVVRIIDEKLTVGMNSVIMNLESQITTDVKPDVAIATAGKNSFEVTTVGKTNVEVTSVRKTNVEVTTVGKDNDEDATDGKSTVEITTDDEVTLGQSNIAITTEVSYNAGSTYNDKVDVKNTDSTDARLEPNGKPDIVSTTETAESLLGEDQGAVLISKTEIMTTEPVPIQDFTHLPNNPGTEWSVVSSESLTTDNALFTSEKSREMTTEYPTTTAQAKKYRKRRAAPKRKRRPTDRNKLKQSLKLPTCTSADLYEVRVDKALSPSKKTELESADIGVAIAKDKIRQEENDALVLPTITPLQAGKRYRLTMSFSGKMARQSVGLYRSDYTVEEGGRRKSKYVATTVLEPIYARRVFPCLDDPRFRARFSMRIAHPPNLSAYSNMPASTTSDDVDSTSSSGIPAGWLWDRFETSPPMPTYLVAFFVGALARKSRTAAGAPGQNDLMVRVLARRERLRDASFALNLAPKVMMEMGQWLRKPTSLKKLDLLAMPGPGPDAVENWGLVSFQERYLLTQPGLLSRFSVASVLSHELAHDWFGNLVTPHHWRYAWLSEGLATYSSAKILNKIQPTWDVEDLATAAAYIAALSYSDDNDAVPMQPKKISSGNYRAVFSPAAYYRGYMMMRMLKGIIGDEMLTGSLQRYVQDNEFGWAKSSRLWAAVIETAKEQNVTLDIPRSLPKLMAAWIEQPGYPLVTITRNYTSGEVDVQQERYYPARTNIKSNATWWIPLRTWTAKTTGAVLQWLPPSSRGNALRLFSPAPIGGDQWLMANAEFATPLRVQYDLKNWDLLAAALPNGELPRGAGAQLSVDALSLASDGQLPFSVALKVVSAALRSRTGDAHLTWTAAGPALKRIDRKLRATKASRPYRQWLHRLITPLDTWISFDARNDTMPDAVLARHVTSTACSLAEPLCLTTGRSQFRSWMASNAPEPRVPIELRGTLYCAAVRDSTSDTIWRYLWSKISTVETDEKIRILKGLGCTRDPELAKRLLQLAADVKSPVHKKQLPTIARSIAMHDSGPGAVLSFLAENIQRFANDTKTLRKLIGEVAPAINSKKDMKKLQSLLPQITTSRATMAKISAEATTSMERSQRLSQGIFAYFNKSKKQT